MRNGSDSWVMVPPSASTSPGTAVTWSVSGSRLIDHREFHAHAVFRVVFGFALLEAHVAGDREQIGGEAAGEHDDEAEVGELDAEFAPGPAEAADVRGDQVHQQHRADQMAAGKHRDAEAAGRRATTRRTSFGNIVPGRNNRPKRTCASVPAKTSTRAAARQNKVRRSEEMPPTIG